jgi:protein ImuB
VDRWACVSVAALPLQLVVRRRPEWRALATVVVSEDKPQGKVLWANASALAAGVLPGHSYALALSFTSELRACVVSELEVEAATREIKALLWRFSPAIEAADETGVFWLDASGLRRLFLSLEAWASALRQQLLALGFEASVVVGFSRFGSYAAARASGAENRSARASGAGNQSARASGAGNRSARASGAENRSARASGAGNQIARASGAEARDVRVFASEAEERACLERVPLACLDIEPEFRDVLAKLGVHSIAGLLDLPANGLLTRFGKTAARLRALAAGEFAPLDPDTWLAPLVSRALLDDADSDTTRLLFVIKRLLDELLGQLALRAEALSSLALSFKLDRKRGLLELEALRPAVPTLDIVQLMDLVRLRMESLQLEVGVVEVSLEVKGVEAAAEQLRVFAQQPRRDLAAGNRAIARLRAEFGENAVVRAVLRAGHLPEACFGWQALEEMQLPAAKPAPPQPAPDAESATASLARRPLIRRIHRHPEVLSAPARQLRDDGWLIRGAQHGPVTHSAGPYVIVGGWWQREVHREYQYLLTRRGELLWVYQDKRRRRWFLHAEVQ